MTQNPTLTLAQKIYDQHNKAFNQVSAFVILKNDEFVATIAFKFPRDGAGRLWAYVHFIGLPMVRGYADGYGYDKRSAAVEGAIGKIRAEEPQTLKDIRPFISALINVGGYGWQDRLREAGFHVLQAV